MATLLFQDDVPVDTCRQFLALFGNYQNALKDYRNEEEVVGVANPSKLNDLRDQTIELIGFFPELVRSYIWLFPVFPPPAAADPSLLHHDFTKLYVQRVQVSFFLSKWPPRGPKTDDSLTATLAF